MKIQSIGYFPNKILKFKKCENKTKDNSNLYLANVVKTNKDNFLAFYQSNITFKSNYDLEKRFNKEESQSYIKFLAENYAGAKEYREFLNSVVSQKETRDKFFDEITQNPKKSQQIVELMQKRLGGKDGFLSWYLDEEGYVANYEKYLRQKYKNAETMDELIKIQPNWGYWALEQKQIALDGNSFYENELMRDRKVNFEFGKIPDDFGSKFYFNRLIEYLKGLEFDTQNAYFSGYNSNFIISQLSGGDRSAKNVYKVQCSENPNKKYIVKIDRFYTEDKLEYCENPYFARLAKESRLLKGDSIYLDACIDYYLQLNGINSNAKLLYYNFDKNASIYEYVEHDEANNPKDAKTIEQIRANQFFKDLNSLGIYLNDIGDNYNYCKDKKGNFRVIDIGHAEFIDILRPGARLLTIELANLCGFSVKNTLAGLSVMNMENLNSSDKLNISFSQEELIQSITQKNVIKNNLKNNIESAQENFGKQSNNTLEARCELIDFYIKNIIARKQGYASFQCDIIKGLLDAIRRQINEIQESDYLNKFAKKLEAYREFVIEQEEKLIYEDKSC